MCLTYFSISVHFYFILASDVHLTGDRGDDFSPAGALVGMFRFIQADVFHSHFINICTS